MADPYTSLARMDHAPSKSTVRNWLDKVTGGATSLSRAKGHVSEAAHGVRQYGETVVVASALAAIKTHNSEGLDYKGVPIDGALAAVGLAGSVVLADGVSADLRNAGAAAAAIFTFRKAEQFLVAKKQAKINGEGDMGAEDPIVAAARML